MKPWSGNEMLKLSHHKNILHELSRTGSFHFLVGFPSLHAQCENKTQGHEVSSNICGAASSTQTSAIMSDLSSLSREKVINSFPGGNFICVFILKYRELSWRGGKWHFIWHP